jgi:hypothetical protein
LLQVGVSFDAVSGIYDQHCLNITHHGTLANAQLHQKTVALLTLGEILVEKIIPVGTTPEIKINGGDVPSDSQLRSAFERYVAPACICANLLNRYTYLP